MCTPNIAFLLVIGSSNFSPAFRSSFFNFLLVYFAFISILRNKLVEQVHKLPTSLDNILTPFYRRKSLIGTEIVRAEMDIMLSASLSPGPEGEQSFLIFLEPAFKPAPPGCHNLFSAQPISVLSHLSLIFANDLPKSACCHLSPLLLALPAAQGEEFNSLHCTLQCN